MRSQVLIERITKISVVLLILTGILSFFNIGPTIEPLYLYVPTKKLSFFIGVILLSISLMLGCSLIFSILNNKLNSFYEMGVVLLSVTVGSNLLLGGNILFIVTAILSIAVLIVKIKTYVRD